MGQYNKTDLREVIYSEFSIISPTYNYPFTASGLQQSFSKYQNDLYQSDSGISTFSYHWDDFLQYCLIEITIMDDGNMTTNAKTHRIIAGRRYSENEFIDTLNEKVNHSPGYFTQIVKIKIYNYVSNIVPTLDRLIGINQFYNSIIGGHMLGRNTFLDTNDSRLGVDSSKLLVQEAWLSVWGITISDVDFYANQAYYESTIWFQGNKRRNQFALPPVNENITIEVGCNEGTTGITRGCFNINTSVLETPDQLDLFRITSGKVASINQEFGIGGGINWNDSFKDMCSINDTSFAIFYGVQSGDRRAIYVKPAGGIDNFCVSRFDINLYRLEAIYSSPIGGHRKRFRFIEVGDSPDDGTSTYTQRLLRSNLMKGSKSRNQYRGSKNKDMGWTVKFYLRKLNSDFVSEVSKTYIKAHLNYNKKTAIDFLVTTD